MLNVLWNQSQVRVMHYSLNSIMTRMKRYVSLLSGEVVDQGYPLPPWRNVRKVVAVISSRFILLIILIGVLNSCEENAFDGEEFTVVVESQGDISCGLPVVRFVEKPDKVRAKTSMENLEYNVYNLSPNLVTTGNRLKIRFITTSEKDLRPCKAIGIWYPPITIITARQIE